MVQLQVPDRMYFEQYQVNGITVYQRYKPDALKTVIYVVVPVGSLSKTKYFGLSHLLEHMVIGYSSEEPHRHQGLWNDIEHAGGILRAETGPTNTTFRIKIPNNHKASDFQRRLAVQIFYPKFYEKDLEEEKDIVKGEIAERSHFFPTGKEETWYAFNKWLYAEHLKSELMLGTFKDVDQASVHDLYKLQQKFFSSPGIRVIASGGSILPLLSELQNVSLTELPLDRYPIKMQWDNPDFREVPVSNLQSQYSLWIVAILNQKPNAELLTAYRLLNVFLRDPQLGILPQEYVRNRQIACRFRSSCIPADDSFLFDIGIEGINKTSLYTIHQDFMETMNAYFTSQFLNRFIDEIQYTNLGDYLKPDFQVSTAWWDLYQINTIRSHTFQLQIAEQFRDPAYVRNLWNALTFHSIMFTPK